MNGDATAAGGGAATSRKTHLRPILGNSAPQRPPAMKPSTTDAMLAAGGNKRQQHPRVAYPGARSTSGVSVNYRLKQQQTAAIAAAVSTGTTATPAAAPLIITPPDSPETASSNKTTQKIQVQQPIKSVSVLFNNIEELIAYLFISNSRYANRMSALSLIQPMMQSPH